MCHLGTTADAPPLTSFTLSGCGDGTTPPLDESEWEDLAATASDTSAFSAPDDQQLTATYNGGVVHYDCRSAQIDAGSMYPLLVRKFVNVFGPCNSSITEIYTHFVRSFRTPQHKK